MARRLSGFQTFTNMASLYQIIRVALDKLVKKIIKKCLTLYFLFCIMRQVI